MNQSDRYHDSEMGPTYVCSDCGSIFKSKFRDSQLCLSCRGYLHDEIHAKLGTKMNLTNNYIYTQKTETISFPESKHIH